MSLLKLLQESDGSLTNNIDIDFALNKLYKIQESSKVLNNKLRYTAEMVPVINLENGKFAIALSDLLRLRESECECDKKDCSIEDVLNMMQNTISDEGMDITMKDICVCCDKEDCKEIGKECKKDPTMLKTKLAKVVEYTNILNQIKNTGATIVMNV